MTEQTWQDEWIIEDAWDLSAFANLCCGFEPGSGKSDDEAIAVNKATAKINTAVRVGAIPCIDPIDTQGAADILYGTARYFKPCAVVEWATTHFKSFPYEECDLPGSNQQAPTAPANIAPEVAGILNALCEAAVHFFPDGVDKGATNDTMAKWLGKKVDISTSLADKVVSIIRPDAAKLKTWPDNPSKKR